MTIIKPLLRNVVKWSDTLAKLRVKDNYPEYDGSTEAKKKDMYVCSYLTVPAEKYRL